MATIDRVTKFVPANVFERVLDGAVKLGCLQEYRDLEAGREHRLVDPQEGKSSMSVEGSLYDEHFMLGTNNIHLTCITLGTGKAVVVDHKEDALVFCTALGPYCRDTHERFIAEGNESCTHYIVYDLDLLGTAAKLLMDDIAPKGIWGFASPVAYSDKDTSMTLAELERQNLPVSSSEAPQRRRERIFQSVLTKSKRFKHEQEHRVAFVPVGCDPAPFRSPLYVGERSATIQSAFRQAIVSHGHASPKW